MYNFTNTTPDYNQDNSSVEDVNIKYKLNIIVPVIWSLIILFGILGNGLIIYIILKRRLYKNSCTNCYIMNVAIADLCFTLACVPVTMTAYVYKEWIFGSFMCHFQNLIMFSSIQAACLTLTAMTVDRYLAVLYPFKSIEYRTTKIALITNLIIWIASLTLNFPYYIYYIEEQRYCFSRFPSHQIQIGLTIYTVLISYVLPLLTIIFCYMRMIIKIYGKSSDQKLVEQSKNFSNQYSLASESSYKKGKKSSLKSELGLKIDANKNDFFIEDDISDNENNFEIKKDDPKSGKQLLSENSCRLEKPLKGKTSIVSGNNVYQTYSTRINGYTHYNANSALTIKKQKFKILLLIAIVSITFAVTWLPAHVIQIWKVCFNSTFPYSDAMYIIKLISHTLTYSNSLLNPFIYVFIGSKFRSHINSEFSEIYQVYCLRRKKEIKKSNTQFSNAGSYVAISNKNRVEKCSSVSVLQAENVLQKKNSINLRRL